MAIRNDRHGRGISTIILDWASAQVRRNELQCLRLDCQASNARLRGYHEDRGFIYERQLTDRDYVAALYKRPA